MPSLNITPHPTSFSSLTVANIDGMLQYNLEKAINALDLVEKQAIVSWLDLQQLLYVPLYNLSQAWTIALHLESVISTPELRNLREKFQPQITSFYVQLGQSIPLYEHFKYIQKNEYQNLGHEEQKIIDNEFRDFKLSGIELDKGKQARYGEIQTELSQLTAKFEQNLMDATDNYAKYVTHNELQGVPKDLINEYKQAAIKDNKPDLYKITLHMPSYLPIMEYCDNRQLREELYYNYVTRASELGKISLDNSSVICKILELRDSKALLLGFANYTELSLYTKMANTSKQILDFLYRLADKSKTHAEKDLAELTQFAKTNCSLDTLQVWDIPYVSEKLQQHKYSYSNWELKQYFQLPKVLNGLFQLTFQLYKIEFKRNLAIEIWHADVIAYDVTSNNNKIGTLYLDLFARNGKQPGAWMNSLQDRFITEQMNQLPIAAIMCNFAPPTAGNEVSLLTFDEVQTLFHEMGHALHQLLSQINHFSISGINGVEWDAVELPSQFMEYFTWNHAILKSISSHINTGAAIPDDLYNKVVKARHYQSGLAMLRQIEFAVLDILLHENKILTVSDYQKLTQKVRSQIAVIFPPEYNRFLNSFSHIFAGGYASGYYSYKWAEVLATDVFSRFEAATNIEYPDLGNKFYTTILSKGGVRPMMESFTEFMGREPQIDALLKHSGIN